MNLSLKFSLLACCVMLLFSCGRSPRDRSKIPPAPIESEKMRNTAAIEALTDAIRSNPSVPENYYKRAVLYLKSNQNQDALDDINRADRLKSNVGRYLYIKAVTLRELGKPDEALATAQSAEILNIDTPELYTLLGDLAQRKNDFVKANAYLAKSLQIAPYNGETYYYQGLLAAREGDSTKAINSYLKTTQLKPDYLNAYKELTTLFKKRQLYDSALVFNNKARHYYPNDAALLIDRGLVFQSFGRLDSAAHIFEDAAKLDPEHVEALIYAGAVYFRWKSYSRAVEIYKQAIKQKPNLAKLYYLTGLSYEHMDMITKAEEYYKMAFEKDPQDVQSTDAYARISGQLNQGIEDPAIAEARKEQQRLRAEKLAIIAKNAPKKTQQKLLDTTRIRINVIAPKSKVDMKSDEGAKREIKIK